MAAVSAGAAGNVLLCGRIGAADVQPIFDDQEPSCDHRVNPRYARHDRQPSNAARYISRLHGTDRPERTRWCARTDDGTVGNAGAASIREWAITNIRNTKSAHWRAWLKLARRCVVPWTSFCEYADTKPRKTPTWFAFDEARPLAVFAVIWANWHGKRGTKANPIEGEHQLFGFLTTDANDVVGAIHPKAMPVILTTADEIETWMTAPAEGSTKVAAPVTKWCAESCHDW